MKNDNIAIINHTSKKMTLREAIAKKYNYSKEVNTRDIYQLVGVNLLARDYYNCTLEEKAVMVEEEIKKYIANKLGYCEYIIPLKEALKIELSELLTKLYLLTDKEVVYGVIHYILGLIMDIQGYQVIWQIENSESYIMNPTLEEEGETLDRLKTHVNTDPIVVFNLVFEYYLSKCNKNNLTYIRKKEELPKNGK